MKQPFQHLIFVLVFTLLAYPILAQEKVNLALDRPVFVSSTSHAATQAEFAVDGENMTGWRSDNYVDYSKSVDPVPTLPQWIFVDLQACCKVTGIHIFCEADSKTPEFVHDRRFTSGHEIYSSYPTLFEIQGSNTAVQWTILKTVSDYQGGSGDFELPSGDWRFIRLLLKSSSSILPIAINEFQVFGECNQQRPATNGWKTRRKAKNLNTEPLYCRNSSVLPIMSGWEMVCEQFNDTAEGRIISTSEYDSRNWYNAQVPGTVIGTLVEQEVFPDPVVGLNNLRIPDAICRYDWWYRREFDIPSGFDSANKRVFLELDKINHHADVWFNGNKLGNIDYCFVQAAYDVTGYLNRDGKNVVAVRISPMKLVGVPGDKSKEGSGWVNSRIISKSSPTYICSSGWDWMPATRDRASGILEEVRLRSVGDVQIKDPHIITDLHLPDTTKAYISINVPIVNESEVARKVTVCASFDKIKVSETVEIPAGERVEVNFSPERYKQLKLNKPALWWPNGYGAANLYDLKITALDKGIVSDSYETKFGIRKVTYNLPLTKERRGGQYFDKTSARYVKIEMEDSYSDTFGMFDFSVYNTEDLDNDLAAWKPTEVSSGEKSAQFLTDVRGVSRWHSKGNKHEWVLVDLGESKVIDYVIAGWHATGLASKYKILVSEDKQNWKTVKECTETPSEQLVIYVNGVRIYFKGGNWGYEELALRMPEERMETCIKFHKDAKMNMIRGWMGNVLDENFFKYCDKYGIMVFSDLWGGMPLDPVRYCEIAKENIIRFRNHPSIALWCASNETYPAIYIDSHIKQAVQDYDSEKIYIGNSADDIVVGGDGIYFWVPPVKYYGNAHGFKTEIGLPCIPVYETALNTFGSDQSWPIGDVWYYHDFCNMESLGSYLQAINGQYGEAVSLKDFCQKAQFVNYYNMRAIFEAWNHKLWDDCSALLLWMTHPTWYSFLWQTYDYDFDVNGVWAGAKKGCESLHVQASLPDWQVSAVNISNRPLKNLTLTASIYDADGKCYWSKSEKNVSIPASDAVKSFNIEFADNLPEVFYVKLQLSDAKGKVLSDNFYWESSKGNDFTSMISLPETEVVGKASLNDGKWMLTIKNEGNVLATMMRIAARDKDTGDRLLPTFYSDNYIWLLPGEERVIEVECPKGTEDSVYFEITGYNSKATINHNI